MWMNTSATNNSGKQDDVEREEAVQRDVRYGVVAANPLDQRVADNRNRANSEMITCAPQ